MASTTTAAPERISDDEAAILRAWLGGHRVQDVAKGRHEDPGHVGRVIDRLCNYQRDQARAVLDSGLRPAGTAAVARREPAPAAPLPTEPIPTEAAPALEPEPAPPTGVAPLPAPPSYPVRQPRTGNGRARNTPDPVEAVRVQRVVDEVLLDHSPAVTAVVDAARALDAALREPGVTWYRAPWGAMTDLMRACAVLDQQPNRPLPDQPGDAQPPAAAMGQAGRIDALLAEAGRDDVQAVRQLADKIRAIADDLDVMLSRRRQEQQIRALIAQKRRELDEAHEQLRRLTGKPAARAHDRTPGGSDE